MVACRQVTSGAAHGYEYLVIHRTEKKVSLLWNVTVLEQLAEHAREAPSAEVQWSG